MVDIKLNSKSDENNNRMIGNLFSKLTIIAGRWGNCHLKHCDMLWQIIFSLYFVCKSGRADVTSN